MIFSVIESVTLENFNVPGIVLGYAVKHKHVEDSISVPRLSICVWGGRVEFGDIEHTPKKCPHILQGSV